MIFKVTRYRTYFLEAESEEQARVLCNLQRFSLDGLADFPGRPFEYKEGSTIEPYAAESMCKHDDGDCHADDPCDYCPVYKKGQNRAQ